MGRCGRFCGLYDAWRCAARLGAGGKTLCLKVSSRKKFRIVSKIHHAVELVKGKGEKWK